jgi:hypothetical protein
LALAVGYAFLMYFRDKRFAEYSHFFIKSLAVLRTISVFIIALLLLSPFVKTIKEDTKTPIILIASDISESVAEGTTSQTLINYKKDLDVLSNDLASKYEVKRISFGSDVYPDQKDSLPDKSTNISKLFRYVSDNYSDQNLGAVIMGTDGIFNEGNNPLYINENIIAPLYTIALGDTMQKKDLYFQNVLHNKIAYLGDKFPVQIDVSAFNCVGSNTKLTLEMISGGQVRKLAEENIKLDSKSFFTSKTFLIDADLTGVIRYRLKLSALPDEFNTNNNIKEFFVEVLDGRQKILLLANAPHPDLAALKNIISENKNYETDLAYIKDWNGNLSKYNLVILHNLPSETADISALLMQLDKNNTPRIFIVGLQTSQPKFNKAQDVIQISGNSRNSEEVQAELNPGFTLFTTSDNLKNRLATFPPLMTPFGEYKVLGTANTYLYQNIKKIKTNYPLMAFGEKSGIKTTVFCGEGIWKWRLFDHLQNKNYDLINELISKTVLLTTVKSDKRKFRTSTSKNLYKDNEQVLFDAQLFNDNYEMINEPDVKLVIKDESQKEFSYNFSKTQNYYTLNADLFPQGSYTYAASTSFNGKVLTVNGKFNVESVQLEQFDLTARHGLLRGLSEKYNGKMLYPSEISSLKDVLLSNENIKPVMYQTNSTKAIIHLKWLFFLILTILAAEWFLRRYFGNY